MKKLEKYIYVVLALIIGAVLASTVTYIVMDKKYDNHNNNEQNVNNNGNKEENKEEIKLSEEELEKYLSYVPKNTASLEESVYYKPSNNSNIDKSILLGNALSKASQIYLDKFEGNVIGSEYENNVLMNGNVLFKKDYIDSIMLEMYNVTSGDLENSERNYIANGNGFCYYFNNGYFEENYCIGSESHISIIEDYIVSEEQLVISEYASYYDGLQSIMTDCYTKKEVDLTYLKQQNIDYDQQLIEAKNYLKNNKNNFTEYKHTFKKNDNGYYWYSTEVIK